MGPLDGPGQDAHAGEGPTGPSPRDREAELTAVRMEEIRRRLVALVTPELIEEHRRRPTGNHSPALAELLVHFRQAPTAGKLATLAVEPGRRWQVVRLSGAQGVAHDLSDPARFDSEAEAAHEVFLRRLAELGWRADVG
jgi:hypothetical protein